MPNETAPTVKGRMVGGVRKLIRTVDLGTNNLVVDLGPIFNLWGAFQYMRPNLGLMNFLWVLRTAPLSFVTMGLEKTFHHQNPTFFIDHLTHFIEEKLTNLCSNLLLCTFSPA
jgi:hypothetical protein